MICDQLLSFSEKPVHPDLIQANHLIGFCKHQSAHISAWVCEHQCNYKPELKTVQEAITEAIDQCHYIYLPAKPKSSKQKTLF